MRRVPMAVMAIVLGGCTQGSNDVCTTDPSRATIQCTPAATGCLGRDLGYADDNLYGPGCSAPRQDDESACATLYDCDESGSAPRWQPVQGF